MAALDKEDIPLALSLVQRGADVNALNEFHALTALTSAAGLGDEKLVRAMLERGASLKKAEEGTYTPLMMALENGHEAVARLLLEKGSEVNTGDGGEFGRRPLVLAAAQGWVSLVSQLLDKGAEINHVADDGVTALSGAVGAGHLDVVELLVSKGAKIESDPLLMTSALSSGSVPVVRYLLGKGRTLTESVKGSTLLHSATLSGNPELIGMVLDAGADINVFNADGDTPLLLAARNHIPESVTFLLEKKARIDILTPDYQSALDLARETNLRESEDDPRRKATIAALEKAGVKTAPPSLCRAAVREDPEQLKSLLADGSTPLFAAATEGRADNARLLLEAGANPNVRSMGGYTALMVASDRSCYALVEQLLAAGADPGIKNEDGQTAHDIAVERHHTAIVRLLERVPPSSGKGTAN
jgi:ankyrin repeat protein